MFYINSVNQYPDLLIKLQIMKINESVPKNFDSVNFFRKIKDKISKETYGLSNEQLLEYYKDANKEAFFKRLDEAKAMFKK